jgi:hypothetical protein
MSARTSQLSTSQLHLDALSRLVPNRYRLDFHFSASMRDVGDVCGIHNEAILPPKRARAAPTSPSRPPESPLSLA